MNWKTAIKPFKLGAIFTCYLLITLYLLFAVFPAIVSFTPSYLILSHVGEDFWDIAPNVIMGIFVIFSVIAGVSDDRM